MAPLTPRRPLFALVTGVAMLALLLPGCAKKSAGPVVGGTLGFDQAQAVRTNGPIPAAQPTLSCGSNTAEFASELIDTAPNKAKVKKEWGNVIATHPEVFIAGTIKNIVFSNGDLTFTHPYGLDFTFDVTPDAPYTELAQVAGKGTAEGGPEGTIHMEIEQGLMPHASTNFSDVRSGFIPSVGDRVATFGRWIIDCGHNDYHTEIHPTTFLAFAHTSGSSTIVHTFYNPYWETQLFNPDAALANQVTNTARLTDPNTKPFPAYLVAELLRVGHLGPAGPLCCHDRIEAHILEAANTQAPLPFYVCAPGGKSSASFSYHFVVRPGVTVSAKQSSADGCVEVRAEFGQSFAPAVPVRKDCVDPWAQLTAQAEAATGSSGLDIKALIEKQVPASFISAVERDPVVDCYDPLTGPDPGPVGAGKSVTTSSDTAFPFYGWIEVSS